MKHRYTGKGVNLKFLSLFNTFPNPSRMSDHIPGGISSSSSELSLSSSELSLSLPKSSSSLWRTVTILELQALEQSLGDDEGLEAGRLARVVRHHRSQHPLNIIFWSDRWRSSKYLILCQTMHPEPKVGTSDLRVSEGR